MFGVSSYRHKADFGGGTPWELHPPAPTPPWIAPNKPGATTPPPPQLMSFPTNSKAYATMFQGRAGPPDPPRVCTCAPRTSRPTLAPFCIPRLLPAHTRRTRVQLAVWSPRRPISTSLRFRYIPAAACLFPYSLFPSLNRSSRAPAGNFPKAALLGGKTMQGPRVISNAVAVGHPFGWQSRGE